MKKSKGHIVIIVICAVLSVVFVLGLTGFLIPHKKSFVNVCYRSSGLYTAHTTLGDYYLDSDTDLSSILPDNDPNDIDSLGEQTLMVRFSGFRVYNTDMMGMFVHYPAVVYEVVL